MRDEARLGDLAAALAEGSDVDWEQAEQHSADEQERSLIRELRLIAQIADLAQLAPLKLLRCRPHFRQTRRRSGVASS